MKMVKKIQVFAVFLVLVFLISIISVYALEAKILGGRMVLYPKTGEIVERSIKIINSNQFPVKIELFTSGDLADYMTLEENNFTLDADEEKNVSFTIKVAKEGQTQTKIDVKFIPEDEANGKNGVVLSSTIIIIAAKGNGTINFTPNSNNTNTDNTGYINSDEGNDMKINPTTIAIIITLIVFFILVGLVIYSRTKKNVINKGGEKINSKKRAHQ